jgi:hypothetical protein
MELHGLWEYIKAMGDLFVLQAFHDEPQNFALPPGEVAVPRVRALGTHGAT